MISQFKPRILIVDDAPVNIKVLANTLKHDYELGVAINGFDALEYIKSQTPDLILLDVLMPKMDGYETCSRLKNIEKTKDIPIIFISSLDEIENKTKGFKLGAVDYITKPFEIVEVQARVKMHIERKLAKEALKVQNLRLAEVSRKLSKYLAPQIYDSIFSGNKDVKVETQRKTLSIFFSDIQAFTELTDFLEPESLTYLLNDYLNEMSEIALRYGGTIDKFMGDAILIFFGDPETKGVKEDALSCVLMALEMRERMKVLRKRWIGECCDKELFIRMGISTGYCTVGNFGSENRLEYTIIGGQVNLANRLQAHANPDQILISQKTYSQVKNEIFCEKKVEIKVKGMTYPVQTYQVINAKGDLQFKKEGITDEAEKALVSIDFKIMNKEEKQRLVNALRTTINEIEADKE